MRYDLQSIPHVSASGYDISIDYLDINSDEYPPEPYSVFLTQASGVGVEIRVNDVEPVLSIRYEIFLWNSVPLPHRIFSNQH